jgi:glutaredoxin
MFNRNLKIFSMCFGFLLLACSSIGVFADTTTSSVDTGNLQNTVSTQPTVTVETPSQRVIIYASTTCPHCKKVKDFVATNNVPDVEFRETDTNPTYLEEYKALYDKYKVDEASRGVPVLEDNGGLISGDQPIIDFLTKKFNITPKQVDTTIATSSSDVAFIIIGGLVILGVIGYGVYSTINKN